MYALSLSCQILLMFEVHWPMKAFFSSTCYAGRGRSQGGDVALNSLLRTCISLKHPLSCRALHQAGRVYGQVESVFLMDLSLEKPAGAVFINPARFRFWDIDCGSFLGAGGGGNTPYNSLYGEALPKSSTFSRLQEYERVGITLVEIYDKELVAQKMSKLKNV